MYVSAVEGWPGESSGLANPLSVFVFCFNQSLRGDVQQTSMLIDDEKAGRVLQPSQSLSLSVSFSPIDQLIQCGNVQF